MIATKTTETMYRCKHVELGYVAEKQQPGSIYWSYTQNPDEAKLFKNRQRTARDYFNYQSWQSKIAKENLSFEEVRVITTVEIEEVK